MSESQHTQVLVAGGGHAGLCAAISAREAGAEVMLLERAPRQMRGGNTRHTRNLRVAHVQTSLTLQDSYPPDAFYDDILRVTEEKTHPELARLMIEESEALMHWLHARGVHFQPSLTGTLSLAHTNAFFLGGGCALLNALYIHAERIGVEIQYDCPVTGVTIENNRFLSAQLGEVGKAGKVGKDGKADKGGPRTITASAFVAAAGGFQANAAWMARAWGEGARNFLIRGTPYNDGTLLENLLAHGATQVAEADQCHAVAIDARAPRYDGGIVSRLDCVAFSIVVNQAAQRFYDEGEDFWPKRYAIWGRLVAQQANQTAYAIFDNKVVNNFMPSIFPPFQANSITGLAEKLQLEPGTLHATVERFNAAVCDGEYDPTELDGCHTEGLAPGKSHWALALDSPPYYAYPLKPGITFTYLGVAVDRHARVQFGTGPADNLFAAGEIMAGNILGQGYCAGTGMTIGGVFGRIAGAEAAALL